MFEKSLYDLIRGLRTHKGSEKEYIADSIKECRQEIRSNDMDLKSTALMKLTYLEMFGHDMSWASFNVLEVMSSPKFRHKRTGYLAAVQSFRRDTEVLVLAENQLKKDIMLPTPPFISLPLGAIPHVINPSMANSVLSDLIPRLTHSSPQIRKKTVVTLYRLALVYPETLRPAWPKIKERLLDENEDPSVTAAIVNVVCELGWRRPQDFLPLAPRLFDLLVEGGNNWMAIKLIKLFATLTPLEPRLIKKLLPPLTKIIRETSAMSLLYECISGIIQGGILEAVEGTTEGEEVAKLCVGKLRGMMVIEGDSNLKYVALLAFEKIVGSHPYLVGQQQDVILECIDDPDISIRTRALDLVVGMVNPDNLTAIVGRLMRQLRNAPVATGAEEPEKDRSRNTGVVPYADSDDEDAEEALPSHEQRSDQPPPLPDDYRTTVIRRILEMCSRDTYSNVTDFEWYIDVLTQLVRVSPAAKHAATSADDEDSEHYDDVGARIGHELQNVAVRVRSVRHEAVDAAQSLVLVDRRDRMFPASGNGGQGVLGYAGWLVGEYATYLSQPEPVMTSLLHPASLQLSSKTLAVYLQAIPKVFSSMAGNERISWTPERKTLMSLLMARIIHFLEPLSTHPSLEVQERAVEYLELMRLAAEAASGAPTDAEGDFTEPPLLLTQAIPALFSSAELNPVAPGAQRKVPVPDDLDLDTPINPNLHMLLSQAEQEGFEAEEDDVYAAYSDPIASYTSAEPTPAPAADRLDTPNREPASYQNAVEEEYLDPDIIARRKAERKERYKDDPFYIDPEGGTGAVTPLSRIVRDGNKDGDLDIDSIPIMDLDLSTSRHASSDNVPRARSPRKPVRRVEIMGDETLGPASADPEREDIVAPKATNARNKKSLLQVDSAGLASLSLDDDSSSNRRLTALEIERKEQEEAEMARALQAIERSRLEMQRASERVEYNEEGVVKKKKKKVRRVAVEGDDVAAAPQGMEGEDGDAQPVKKKKKKKVKSAEALAGAEGDAPEGEVKKKKKKKRVVVMDE
ncbi:Adaptor protein complex AP-3 delta subunit [Didymella exigua CBS 183.55]|uniref:AP-3 complex subunit delta n=1 Tax=Didymella exigua CBS 183.55 TaxID=1150837 RepID=A0A6A5RTG4_9PLEO|nr:Adaptor protein complex AP-3 delta subunit [Didymella exigua CBS 183.55]KAF1929616.1 Adaptor protein complex AP-3 delta subunit [Didymella exigua CBS 183.55]